MPPAMVNVRISRCMNFQQRARKVRVRRHRPGLKTQDRDKHKCNEAAQAMHGKAFYQRRL